MLDMLRLAAQVALPAGGDSSTDPRNFYLGCVGIRQDGVLVSAKNGAVGSTKSINNYQLVPTSHAEGRTLRKMGKGGVLFVARVAKKDGNYAMSAPCGMCQLLIRAAKIKKVYFTVSPIQYGIWTPSNDSYRFVTIKK